ncbi:MAG: lipoyl synthase [Candidatus Omnitrophota bacterium]|jgi:lipoic acid synthetase
MKKITSRRDEFPEWFRQDIPSVQALAKFRSFKQQGVNTVCLEARCPNWASCLKKGTLAFMILGNRCTRNCSFCAVEQSREKPLPLDRQEPYRILEIIKEWRLNFVIITSVTRDDLNDYGAGQFVRTINFIHDYKSDIRIEILIPDFKGAYLRKVVETRPDVLAHNLETVPRLYPMIRPEANYQRSLKVIAQARKLASDLITKSSLLLGMGEEEKEVIQVMRDLRRAGCDVLVLGQYLSPTPQHYPVKDFISLEQFQRYKHKAYRLGFEAILASPLARTSYQAAQIYDRLKPALKRCVN